MNCPLCGDRLFSQSIVKYKDYGGVKVVGRTMYCPNIKCGYKG